MREFRNPLTKFQKNHYTLHELHEVLICRKSSIFPDIRLRIFRFLTYFSQHTTKITIYFPYHLLSAGVNLV